MGSDSIDPRRDHFSVLRLDQSSLTPLIRGSASDSTSERPPMTATSASAGSTAATASGTLDIRDSRTGQSYSVPISDGTIRAMDLRQVRVDEEDFGLMSYDPAFMNTASCRSAITYIDGDKGILRYRGYPIEELAEQATFLEVAYLL